MTRSALPLFCGGRPEAASLPMSAPVHFACLHREGAARRGLLTTPHGAVPTPAFMAVGTLGGLKGLTVQQAEAAGQGVLLANTYHLALRPGADTVRALGGLHRFSGWRGPMLTDSGGYQVFSLAQNRVISESGAQFRSHLDGSAFALGPESSIAIQRTLGADIIMAFDECPEHTAPREYQEQSMQRTLRWLDRCCVAWREAGTGQPGGAASQALFGIIQGGLHRDLREASAMATVARELPGIALGGLAVGESRQDRNQVLDWVLPLLPVARPRYLMGVGTPLDLVDAVERGVDLFDCVLPTRMGRHGIAYTDAGPLRLKREEHARDPRPIDERIASDAARVSRGYIRHLLKAGESLGGALLAAHNLAYYQDLMQRIRTAIAAGAFTAFAAAFRAGWSETP